MTYIDSAILDVTEWCCRKVQLLTGTTNVWLAVQLTNLSITIYFVWAVAYFWRGGTSLRVFVGLFCAGVLYALTQTVFKVPIDVYESAAYRRVAKGFRNPRRLRDAPLRISFLTLSFVLWYPVVLVYVKLGSPGLLFGYILVILTTMVLYLLACDPLPPCPGKVREWLRMSLLPAPLRSPDRGVSECERQLTARYNPTTNVRRRSGAPAGKTTTRSAAALPIQSSTASSA